LTVFSLIAKRPALAAVGSPSGHQRQDLDLAGSERVAVTRAGTRKRTRAVRPSMLESRDPSRSVLVPGL
jgi:hypothetical protein